MADSESIQAPRGPRIWENKCGVSQKMWIQRTDAYKVISKFRCLLSFCKALNVSISISIASSEHCAVLQSFEDSKTKKKEFG